MDSFSEKFIIEAGEYCERLESGLLQLEQNPGNQQIIGEIFRIMHSLKGSGGMFGFDLLSEVTHGLESLFEIFRSGNQMVDSELIGFTLNSIDKIKELLVENPTEEHQTIANSLKAETKLQMARFLTSTPAVNAGNPLAESSASVSGQGIVTYFISFIPDEDVLKNGTNPLYIIEELHALGECNIQVSTERIPSLARIDPETCYIEWYLFIATSESIGTLNDVFLFVADRSKIEIVKVSNSNVIHQESVLAAFLNARNTGETWAPEGLDEEEERAGAEKQEKQTQTTADLLKETNLEKSSVFGQTKVDSIRVNSEKIDRYMNLVSEFITAQSRLDQLAATLKNPELATIADTWEKLNRQMRDNAFEMSLIPLQSLEVRFKRLIFDLSKTRNKEIELLTEGLETELDKNIIENLTEPLLHMLRNAIDHGIESRPERLQKNKNPVGRITIRASLVGSYAKIEIEDDGEGLHADRIKAKAEESGLLAATTQLTDEELLQLVFEPGFSTAREVTDISGRGVGLDVVKKSVQNMRGTVEIESEKGKFTRLTLKLPLSLSIIDGLLTRIGKNYFVIPSAVVGKLYAVKQEQLKNGINQHIGLEDIQLSCLNLSKLFEPELPQPGEQHLVAVTYGNYSFGLIVDEVVCEYQAVIKPLSRMLKVQDIFSGASILGSGELALVIDTHELIQRYS